jgi:hypothetical protein
MQSNNSLREHLQNLQKDMEALQNENFQLLNENKFVREKLTRMEDNMINSGAPNEGAVNGDNQFEEFDGGLRLKVEEKNQPIDLKAILKMKGKGE